MSCRIVFMGTPDFAVPCLSRLLQDGYELVGVFTQPDRPRGRGNKLAPPPVKELAEQYGIPVFQPEKMRDGNAQALLQRLQPELVVVVAYGRILPPELLAVPRLGCMNVHASLLPFLRGAAPIQHAVIEGFKWTGVTTMLMDEGLDTGDILLQRKCEIGPQETAGELFERLSRLGAELLSETVPLLLSGKAERIPQDHDAATFAPPIQKAQALLDFTRPATVLANLIRGLNPSPMAKARLGGKLVKILAARPVAGFSGAPGEVIDPQRLIVGCGSDALELVQVQPEGKKIMSGEEFSRGRRLTGGEVFTI